MKRDGKVTLTVPVTNIGSRAGDEIVQVWVASSTLGKDALISEHWTHTLTDVTAVVVPTHVARKEVQAVGVVRVRRVLR